MSDLSSRGRALLDGAMPEYVTEHFARSERPWHPQDEPRGYIGLCVAENVGVWDLLRPQVQRERRVEARHFGYDAMRGALSFRQRLAEFLGQRLAGRSIDPEHIAALSGAGSVLEILFYCIADAGDGVLVPTPSYAGFWADLETRNQLHIIAAHAKSENGFALRVE
ncbi:MAG: aminotransferase class I/II-fold pyridoxal phosphate-dependent enzyme, partial [Myxococcota bacterium]